MKQDEALLFSALLLFFIVALVITFIKESKANARIDNSPYFKGKEEKEKSKDSSKTSKSKTPYKHKFKGVKKKKRKPKLKKDEQGLVGRPPKSPRKRKGGSNKVSDNS